MTFPHTATIERLVKNDLKYTYSQIGTTRCFLQPMSAQQSQLYGIAFSKSSKAYLPITSNVREGDKLTIDSFEYGVRGISEFDFGNLKHKYAVLEQS